MNRTLVRRLLEYLKPHIGRFIVAMVLMVVLSLMTGALAYLAGPLVKFVINPSETTLHIAGPFVFLARIPKQELFYYLPVTLIVVALLKGLSFYGQAYFMGNIGQRIIMNIRNDLFQHIQYLPMDYFSRVQTGTLVSRIMNDVGLVQGAVTSAVAGVLRDSFSVVVLIALAFYLDWRLAVLTFLVYPVVGYSVVWVGRKLRRVSIQGQNAAANLNNNLFESISSIAIVKAFNQEAYEIDRFKKFTSELYAALMRGIKVNALFVPSMEFLMVIGFVGAFWYGGIRIMHGTLTPEGFFSFFAAIGMLYQPFKNLSNINSVLQDGLAASGRVFHVLDEPKETVKDGHTEITGIKDHISFNNVSFRYGDREALKGISFKVKKGEVLAIVGDSGAGKSTLVSLLTRFYDVTSGAIKIDGIDIRDIRLKALRSLIGVVTQETILFDDTVYNNILYGSSSAAFGQVIEAAKLAYAHDFIARLPDGYNTALGERGARLSGGERQRIAIARAILKDPSILILDEATSNLDAKSESEVQKALDNLMKGKTTFFIAHRLYTAERADRIAVLVHGELVEEGSHEMLMRNAGHYKKLYTLQHTLFGKESDASGGKGA
ncbi:MAG: ABC transporter ATP-binding protein/permease [Deltaproteobacteria bacterium]|nr:ABC transporter ATP-binding protein/permease [Deltaproteobacteria bacterium]MCL5278196.1 ABC transporter ATP-binding protein/permease [Deltaproteobacteria bacterium]